MGQQVLDGDRQFAGPVAGGVVDRVGDRGGGADLPDFPDALDAERAGDVVLDFDQLDVDVGCVGVDGDEVVAQAGVGPAAVAGVHVGAFEQGLAHAPEHAAHELAAGCPGVEDPAGGEGADHVPDADDAEVGVDRHLGELGAEGQQPVRGVQRRRIPAADGFGVVHEVTLHQAAVGLAGTGVARERHPSAGHDDPGRVGAVQRRLAVADGQRDQLIAHGGGGVMHGAR